MRPAKYQDYVTERRRIKLSEYEKLISHNAITSASDVANDDVKYDEVTVKEPFKIEAIFHCKLHVRHS